MRLLYNFSVLTVAFIFLVPACTLNRNANVNVRKSSGNSTELGMTKKSASSVSRHQAKAISVEKIYHPAPKPVEVTYLSRNCQSKNANQQKAEDFNVLIEKGFEQEIVYPGPSVYLGTEQTAVHTKQVKSDKSDNILENSFSTNSEELQKVSEYKSEVSTQNKKDNKAADLILYLTSLGLVGFAVAGTRRFKSQILKVSRWANQNKKKTKWIIALSQLTLTFAGIQMGKDLHSLGMYFSNSMQYMFGGIALATFVGMLGVEKMQMSMPVFLMRKAGNMMLGMSLFCLSIGVGHHLKNYDKQISPIGYVAEYFQNESNADNQDLTNVNDQSTFSVKSETDKEPVSGGRIALYIFLALLLLCVLFALSCAVFCMEYVLGGIAVSLASAYIMFIVIRGIVRAARERKASLSQ